MKKITLSLIALTALTGAAFANGSDRTNDYTTLPIFKGEATTSASASDNAAIAAQPGSGLTAYERMLIRQQERDLSSR